MELHLIRHGQTNWNEEKRIQGQSDSVLTPLGIQQAQSLGQRLKGIHYDAHYSSSSVRTRQTTENAFPQASTVHFRDNLREIHLGHWEGNLYAEMAEREPASYAHFWDQPHLFAVDGAESFHDRRRHLSAAQWPAGRASQPRSPYQGLPLPRRRPLFRALLGAAHNAQLLPQHRAVRPRRQRTHYPVRRRASRLA